MRAAGFAVAMHGDHFADDAPDELWTPHVAHCGWVAISHDRHIRTRPNERTAVVESQLGLIVVVGSLPFPQIATYFARSRAAIERFISKHPKPWIARFYSPSPRDRELKREPSGRIEHWLSDGAADGRR